MIIRQNYIYLKMYCFRVVRFLSLSTQLAFFEFIFVCLNYLFMHFKIGGA